jgi:hypothetical protein
LLVAPRDSVECITLRRLLMLTCRYVTAFFTLIITPRLDHLKGLIRI